MQIAPHRLRPITAGDVVQLYAEAGWWPNRGAADVEPVLDRAPAVGAWDEARLVGFARVVSDGRLRAFVEDVFVARDYRRRGIATELLRVLNEELREIETVSVFCDEALVPLYAAAGFGRTRQVVLHRSRVSGTT